MHRPLSSFCLIVAFFPWNSAFGSPAVEPPVVEILSAYQAAVVPPPKEGTAILRYAFDGHGLSGTTELVFDLETGRYVDSDVLGLVTGTDGFDGTTAWMIDLSHASTPQEGGDRPMLAVNEAYRLVNAWWHADHGGATIVAVGRDEDGDHLQVTPNGGKTFDAWFDPVSHMLVHIRETRGFLTYDTRYSDFQQRDGLTVAGKIVTSDGGGRDSDETQTLSAVTVEAPRPISAFAMPKEVPNDWSIAGNAASVTVPFRLPDNHIVIDAMVNGKGPFPFMIDTGGHSILTGSTVATLGLDAKGDSPAHGAGEGTQTSGYTRVASIGVGAMTLRDQTVVTLDFGSKAVDGFQAGGMLGFELFQRFVVRVDYERNRLTLIDPKTFRPGNDGTAVPFRFYDHMPEVAGRFSGLPGRFNIDTGSRAEVSLTGPFVAANDLRGKYPDGILTVDGWGVGGPSRSFVARAPSLDLGDVSVTNVVASLATQTKGAFSDANYEGNVGSGFLKRFVVTFDYGHRVIYLKPLKKPLADTGSFDRSGMWLNLGRGGFEIVETVVGGPAEAAGLAKGDEITAIGKRRTQGMVLADARRLLKMLPPGQPIRIDYRRGDEARSATLVPRDLIPATVP